jgi:hypothetical protein
VRLFALNGAGLPENLRRIRKTHWGVEVELRRQVLCCLVSGGLLPLPVPRTRRLARGHAAYGLPWHNSGKFAAVTWWNLVVGEGVVWVSREQKKGSHVCHQSGWCERFGWQHSSE